MAAIQGMRGTGEFGTDFRPKNYRELYTLLEPNGNAPLNAMLAMGSSSTTKTQTHPTHCVGCVWRK